jgi:tetratricopeptide (TPR) repeat protein
MEGYFPSPGLAVLGFPVAMGIVVLLHGWVRLGRLPIAVLPTGIAVMLVNFLAAGGVSFAGVAQSLWLLLALLLNEAESVRRTSPPNWNPMLGRWSTIAVAVVVGALLIAFRQTALSPVTQAETLISEGHTLRSLGRSLPAATAYRQATEADRFSPQPWEYFGEYTKELWLQSGDKSYEEPFRMAARESLARNARSSHAQMAIGDIWLEAYRRFGKKEYLDEAVNRYGIAVKLYPNYNLGRAQFAWALHLSGDEAAAEMEAAEALRLDSLNPHSEQKLAVRRIFDKKPMDSTQAPFPGDRTAEQTLQDLRKS